MKRDKNETGIREEKYLLNKLDYIMKIFLLAHDSVHKIIWVPLEHYDG